jgi:hypothetical protein
MAVDPFLMASAQRRIILVSRPSGSFHRDCGHNADTAKFRSGANTAKSLILLARPKRFELLTPRFVV